MHQSHWSKWARRGWQRRDVGGAVIWLNAGRGADLRDLSGNGNNPTLNSAPTWTAGGPNGQPYWAFNGTTPNFITFPDVFSALTVAECFLVIKRTNNTAGQDGPWVFGSAGVDARFPFPPDGKIYDDFGTTVRKDTGVPTNSPVTDYIVYNVITKSGGWTSHINGAQHFTTATNTVGFQTACILGKGPSTTTLSANVSDLMIVNHELSTAERALVTNSLLAEYGVAHA